MKAPDPAGGLTVDQARAVKDATLNDLAARLDDWDRALVRQAVLHFGRDGRTFSANTWRDLLPESAHRHLPGALKALLNEGLIVADGTMVPSTSGPTKGHRLVQYRLTPKGERRARAQFELLTRPGRADEGGAR